MSKRRNKAYLCPVVVGLVLIVIGIFINMPGGALTTYSSLNGESADYYEFDNHYSTIDEYVGGDAYNYIIGASLVAGKISGTMTVKAICIVAGVLCTCFGLTLMMLLKGKSPIEIDKGPMTVQIVGADGAVETSVPDTHEVDTSEQVNT